MNRRGRTLVTIAAAGLLVAPVVLDTDSFPLSTYPMYSRVRGAEVAFATARGVDRSDRTHHLSLGVIGASDDPLIVAGELRAAIAAGRAGDRCGEIAGRVSRSGDESELRAIEIVTELHDVVRLATGAESLIERTVHARCRLEGA